MAFSDELEVPRCVKTAVSSSTEPSLHRKASCCAVRLGPMHMLAPQRGSPRWLIGLMRGLGRFGFVRLRDRAESRDTQNSRHSTSFRAPETTPSPAKQQFFIRRHPVIKASARKAVRAKQENSDGNES
jgi:hypothetical protein